MAQRNYGPKILFPRGTNKWISRENGLVVDVSELHFGVKLDGMPDGVTSVFSKRLLPKQRIAVGNCFSVFKAKTFIVGVNLNGNSVFYRDPRELELEHV
jgi:hypothetical protein